MCEFCHWNEVSPFIGLSLAEYMEIGFYFLVYSFCLPICLWMVSSGEFVVISKDAGKFCSEGRGKLRSSI